MARMADKNHTGEDDGRRRNNVAAIEPRAAKLSRRSLRCGAVIQSGICLTL